MSSSVAKPKLTNAEIDLLEILMKQDNEGKLKNGSVAKRHFNRLIKKIIESGEGDNSNSNSNSVLKYNENANSPLFPAQKVAPPPQPGTSLYVYNKTRKSRKAKASRKSKKASKKTSRR
jgi:hypothetical protein